MGFNFMVICMAKLLYGVAINDAEYTTRIAKRVGSKTFDVWVCPYFSRWKHVLNRCLSQKFKSKNPTYRDCEICSDWLLFSNFKKWMEKQDWQGKELDKDILIQGNKTYCPEACVFIDSMVNTFINSQESSRGSSMIGTSLVKATGKFRARCRNPLTGESEYIGNFDKEEDASKAWRARKLEIAIQLAATQSDHRVAKALISMYQPHI